MASFSFGSVLRHLSFLVCVWLMASSTGVLARAADDAPQQRRGWMRGPEGVYKARLQPQWFAEGARFWYRNDLRGGAREYIVVDVERGERAPAFDHERLAAALSEPSGEEHAGDRLRLTDMEFADDMSSVTFTAAEKRWSCDLASYECTAQGDAEAGDDAEADDDQPRGRRGGRFSRRPWWGGDRNRTTSKSPDEQWEAVVRDGNIYLHPEGSDEEIQLSDDGTEEANYGMLRWSPDSTTLVAFRITPGDNHEVHLLESSPDGGGRALLHSRPYALPGDKFASHELNLFRIETREPGKGDSHLLPERPEGSFAQKVAVTFSVQQIKPDVEPIDFGWPRLRWYPDGRHFAYEKVDRGHQRFRVIRVDAHTGDARAVIDETTDTFIWTAHTENVDLNTVNWLEESDEIVYASERDGWRHLYWIDAIDGTIKHQITRGEYVVRGIDHIDEENKEVWFRASGRNADQDPYFIHYYRIDFDGSNLVALTEASGNHSAQFSPDRKYIVDTYSRVDQPPVHELRRTSDGSLVCRLEEADIAELVEQGFEPPEVFVAKGRDGQTDIWGLIHRPAAFAPNESYPIIESIYAGPQGSFVPKSFGGRSRFAALLDRGFIVVQIDGMGTANRSKAFHDVCWHNLKDGGLADRVLWIKAAAEKYPYMDTSRVGIFGGSAGGQNAAAAVLFHPDFYKAAVAGCGCHDNRMDKASWNEQWMGYPVGPQYAECSNIDNAHRLQGKLMLIVGEMDNNVPPESTLRFADALIKAEKDFDLVFVPGAGHGMGGQYGTRRMHDFFVRHLLGSEPPDRNRPTSEPTTPDPAEAPDRTVDQAQAEVTSSRAGR